MTVTLPGGHIMLQTDTMRVIWAMSADNTDPAGNDPSYHQTNRGTKSMYLRLDQSPLPLPADAFTVTNTVDNVSIVPKFWRPSKDYHWFQMGELSAWGCSPCCPAVDPGCCPRLVFSRDVST